VSRVGNATTLGRMIGLGFALVLATGLVGAKVVHVGGWIPVVCFGIWGLVALLLAAAWTMRRQPSSLASPVAQLVIARGLPRASSEMFGALVRAESRAREFIAEAAILDPVNNQTRAAEFARAYSAYEHEVASLLKRAGEFDERWDLLWARKPSWARDHLLESPFTRETLDVLTRYIAHRARQLCYMMKFLRDGDDRVVRYIRAWVAHDEASAEPEIAADDVGLRFDVFGSA
jgi:hypothetical protein